MATIYTLKVYAITTDDSTREDDHVVLAFDGSLKPQTRKLLFNALDSGDVTFREDKKVLA